MTNELTRKISLALGAFLVLLPFVLLFVVVATVEGILFASLIFGITIFIVGCIGGGITLIYKGF